MKAIKLTFSAALIVAAQFVFAQTGQWKLAGNSLNGTQKLGSTNSAALNFITSNITRMSLTSSGNLNISSDQSSIQFPIPGATPKPMMLMFPSGTENTNRMIIAHSSDFSNFGLQYNDFEDRFDFLRGGTSIFNVNLGNSSVGVTSTFNVSGTSTFGGNINISSDQSAIQLPNPGSSPKPVMFLYQSGGVNTNRMIISHSPALPDFGLRYNDAADHFEFIGGTKIPLSVTLGSGRVGIGSSSPAVEMHLFHGDGENSNHGFRLQNNGANSVNWTLYATNSDGTLDLFSRNNLVGFFDGSSGEYNTASDLRIKKNIEKTPNVLEKIMQLDIKKYHFLENKLADKKHFGMIAQEVEKIFPEVVAHKKMDGSSNDLYAMNYSAFGVLAIKAIQEQQQVIEKLKADIEELKKEKASSAISAHVVNNTGKSTAALSAAHLNQNAPNPFNAATVISYYLPDIKGIASIEIISPNGQLMKTYPITQKGNGQLSIQGGELSTGVYHYVLKVDGVKVDSKEMVFTK